MRVWTYRPTKLQYSWTAQICNRHLWEPERRSSSQNLSLVYRLLRRLHSPLFGLRMNEGKSESDVDFESDAQKFFVVARKVSFSETYNLFFTFTRASNKRRSCPQLPLALWTFLERRLCLCSVALFGFGSGSGPLEQSRSCPAKCCTKFKDFSPN